MPADHSPFLPWIFALLIPVILYRRFRRNFGRQPLGPARRRMIILSVVAVLILFPAVTSRSTAVLLAAAAGVILGIALALWGASRTRFLTENGQIYYVPHTYTGIAVSALFLGRLIYRIVQLYAVPGLPASDGAGATPAAIGRSPLTAGILFVLIGYYVCYYGLVLRRSRHITPGDLETPAPPSAPGSEGVARGD
jgi:hypothetical protein